MQQLLQQHPLAKTASSWTIDPSHSSAEFSVKHLMIATVRGRMAIARGDIEYDPERPTQPRVDAELEVASIDTGAEQRDAHLRSPDFFDAQTHPTIRFVSTRAEALDAEHGKVHGELTIRGVTKPVVLDVAYEGVARDPWGKQRAAFRATTTIDRTQWGLTWNQALETGGVLVGDKVKVELNLSLVQR
jgi:polyisoprenoid-binding protein YceI